MPVKYSRRSIAAEYAGSAERSKGGSRQGRKSRGGRIDDGGGTHVPFRPEASSSPASWRSQTVSRKRWARLWPSGIPTRAFLGRCKSIRKSKEMPEPIESEQERCQAGTYGLHRPAHYQVSYSRPRYTRRTQARGRRDLEPARADLAFPSHGRGLLWERVS